MNPDMVDKLVTDYPVVFKHMEIGSMSFLPEGWKELMDRLCENLTVLLEEELAVNPEKPDEPLFSVMQIKEKFGGLRFYYQMNTDNDKLHNTIQHIIDRAEDESYDICQLTGKPGRLCKKGSYFMTLCEESRVENGFEVVDV